MEDETPRELPEDEEDNRVPVDDVPVLLPLLLPLVLELLTLAVLLGRLVEEDEEVIAEEDSAELDASGMADEEGTRTTGRANELEHKELVLVVTTKR